MRVRSILLSTVLTLTAVPAAHAAQIAQPQGTWAVTRVEARQPGGAGYCALARRFGNGSIITFARNAARETSIAVDFPPNSFNPGQSYNVVLDPGAGQARTYTTQPVSERGIVIRLGRDEQFYDAIQKGGKLTATINDQSFVFAMSDLASGTQDLDSCLGRAAQATRQAEAAQPRPLTISQQPVAVPVPAPVAAPAVSSVAESEMRAMGEENSRLRGELERARSSYEDKLRQNDLASSTASELNDKLRALQTENAQLKAQATAKPVELAAAVPSCPTPVIDETQLGLLKSENSQLKYDLQAERQRVSLKPDESKLVALQAENMQLKSSLDSEKQRSATKPDESQLAALRLENAQLRSSLDGEKQKAALKPDEGQMLALKAENEQLKTSLETERMKPAPKADESKIAALQEENLQLKTSLDAEKKMAALKPDAAQLNALKDENIQLKVSLESERRDKAAQKTDDITLNLLKAENNQLKSDLEMQRQRVTLTPDDSAAKTLRAENAQLRADIDAQKTKIAALESVQQSAIDDKVAAARNAGDVAAASKRASDAELQLSSLRDQVMKLQSENDTLKIASASKVPMPSAAEIQAGNDAASRLRMMQGDMAQLRLDRDRLAAQVEDLKKMLVKTADASGKDGKIRLASANWDLEQATERYNQAEREIQRMGAAMETERARCSVEKKNIEYMLFDPKITSKEQQAKLAEMEQQLAVARRGQDMSDRDTIAENTKTIKDLRAQLSDSMQQVASLQRNLNDADRQNATMARESDVAAEATIKDLRQQLAQSNDRIAQLQQDLTSASQQKIAVSKQQTENVAAMKQQIASLSDQVATMKTRKPEPVAKADVGNKMADISTASGERQATERISAAPPVPRMPEEIDPGMPDISALLNSKPADKPVPDVVSVPAAKSTLTPMPETAPKAIAAAPLEPADMPDFTIEPAKPVVAENLPVAAPVAKAPVEELAAAAKPVSAKLMTAKDLDALLRQATVKVNGAVQPVADHTSAGRVAYRWQAEELTGTAEQRSMDMGASFDRYVQDYLDQAKAGCKGQFAASPGLVNFNGSNRMSIYETACVDAQTGAGPSAALVFYSQPGRFTAIAHQVPADLMDIAMDARDKIANTLSGEKTASR